MTIRQLFLAVLVSAMACRKQEVSIPPDGAPVPVTTQPDHRCSADGWCKLALQLTTNWAGIWGAASDDFWLVGERGAMMHWDGQTITDHSIGPSYSITKIVGLTPDDVWALGAMHSSVTTTSVLHWDGSLWQSEGEDIKADLRSIWPHHRGRAVFIGVADDGGVMYKCKVGNCRQTELNKNEDNRIVLGFTDSAYWVISDITGYNSSMHQFYGSKARSYFIKDTMWTSGYGISEDDVWVTGSDGKAAHWNGSEWIASSTGSRQHLIATWAASPSDVWAVGPKGTIVHWNGTSWRAMESGTKFALRGVWGWGSRVIAVGEMGTVMVR